jgi:hypothetical protein
MRRLKIPQYAKDSARKGLKYNLFVSNSQKVGLTKQEAKRQGINSGIERAKQLIKQTSLSLEDAKSVARFYLRFRNCKTKRCEMALNLWGGRKFGKAAVLFVDINK